VFSGPVHECLGRSRLVADNRGAGLRIRLLLPGALTNVPWEYLYDEEYGFLGLSPETALVRSVELLATVPPFPVSPPLRVLAMISAPVDAPELQGDEEWDKLNGSLADLADRGMVQVDRLEAGTLAALQRPLRLREYHVLHFVGHGYYDDDAQDGALALEGPNGKTRLVTGRDQRLRARKFLVAYNVFLSTPDVQIAKNIAKAVRFSNGGLRFVKGAGFLVRGQAQVSMNLTDFEQTPIHRAFELVKREAERYGVSAVSSEIVGLVPKKALEAVAEWFLQVENFDSSLILENRLAAVISGKMAVGGLRAGVEPFIEQLAAPTATPGGGSAAGRLPRRERRGRARRARGSSGHSCRPSTRRLAGRPPLRVATDGRRPGGRRARHGPLGPRGQTQRGAGMAAIGRTGRPGGRGQPTSEDLSGRGRSGEGHRHRDRAR